VSDTPEGQLPSTRPTGYPSDSTRLDFPPLPSGSLFPRDKQVSINSPSSASLSGRVTLGKLGGLHVDRTRQRHPRYRPPSYLKRIWQENGQCKGPGCEACLIADTNYGMRWSYLITLTCTPDTDLEAVLPDWYRNIPKVVFSRLTVEFHKSGFLHVHVALGNCSYPDARRLQFLWKHGRTALDRAWHRWGLMHYISKAMVYPTKLSTNYAEHWRPGGRGWFIRNDKWYKWGGQRRARTLTKTERRAIASTAGLASARLLTPEQRRERAQWAALARWSR